MLFPEALTSLDQYRALHAAIPNLPLLANITEFGQTELFSTAELATANVSMVLYPLSAQRAAAKAALTVYSSIIKNGHQKDVTDMMQTRKDLYRVLKYHEYEDTLDAIANANK
jgi:methylisocitrate lyase